MDDVDAMDSVYDYVLRNMRRPGNLDDLLRSKIVCSVSAFDRLLHDIIHTGIVNIYSGNRPSTPKYLDEPIPMRLVAQLNTSGNFPNDGVFAHAMRGKLRALSFQNPEKVADGLSYIWAENRKWQKIATAMGADESFVRSMLKEIVTRRNSIAHEADIGCFEKTKRPIDPKTTSDFTHFMRRLGETIHELVS